MVSVEFNDTVDLSIRYYVLLLAAFSILFIFFVKRKRINKVFVKRFTYLLLFIFLITLFHSFTYPIGSSIEYIHVLLPLLLLYFTLYFPKYHGNESEMVWAMTAIVALLSYIFLVNYSVVSVFMHGRTNASYSILYFLPFMLCHNRKVIRWFFVALVFLVVALSFKRGGLIALAGGVFAYLFVSQISLKNKKIPIIGMVMVAIATIAAYFAFIYFDNVYLDSSFMGRFESMEETGGSHRIDNYTYYLNYISNDSFINHILGHGWNGAIRDSGSEFSCHNDFLEVFVDFGVFGLILYVLLYVSLIRLCLYLIRIKHSYAPAMAASIAMFFLNSMVSHIIIYPWYLIPFAMFWGYVTSTSQNSIIKK
jgi:O-antigen ligase